MNRPISMLVSRNRATFYECTLCGCATALGGSCRGCGAPSLVEEVPTRRIARPPAEWMLTLAHNLAVAGFGALMFRAGDNFGFHMGSDETQCTCQWSPGVEEPYRSASLCEQDDRYEDDEDFWRDDLISFDEYMDRKYDGQRRDDAGGEGCS